MTAQAFDTLLEETKEMFEENPKVTVRQVHAILDELSIEEVGKKIEESGLTHRGIRRYHKNYSRDLHVINIGR